MNIIFIINIVIDKYAYFNRIIILFGYYYVKINIDQLLFLLDKNKKVLTTDFFSKSTFFTVRGSPKINVC